MTDSTGTLSETHSSSSEPTETQLAQAGNQVQVAEPAAGTTIQVIAAGENLQLNFDPADVAKVEVKDGNLEITFKNGAVAVIQGYEEWAEAGGQPTGPQGGVVDMAHLGQPGEPGQTTAAENQAPACEIPNAHVVDVPVPAEGERLTLTVLPGDALRLACSFRDVHGSEVGDNLEMTFPGGGVVVVENFSEWIAAKGATISDCVCGGVNPADFIVALGLNPEDVLPASGQQGGPQGADNHPSFAPGAGPEILGGLEHPHILPPTALGYGAPNPEETFFPFENNDLGGPQANDDPPDAILNILTVHESTHAALVLARALAAASGDADGGQSGDEDGCVPPIPPQAFTPDQTTIQVLNNDTFGPDGGGNPPITAFHYKGDPSLVDNPDGVLVSSPEGDKLVITSSSSDPNANQWHAELIISGENAGKFTFFLDSTYVHEPIQGQNDAFESFSYTIQDHDGDKASANVTVDIVDSVPVANNDCEICFTEPGINADIVDITGNVMANDDLGADQFLPNGTKLISFTYTADDGEGHPIQATADAGQTVETLIGGHLTVNADGSWTYTPPATVNNSNGDVHDDFSYTIRDGDGDTSSATQPICIQDGATPEAFDNKQCVNEGATQNVMIIADVSGSMDDDDISPAPGFQTRLDLEKAALTTLVDKYAALEGTVTITLIAFASGADPNQPGGTDSDGARNLGTFTFSSTSDQGYLDAIAAINSLAIGMQGLQTETEYDDALILAQNLLTTQLAGQSDGTTNTVYFLSDGVPNPLSNGADATGWKSFVNGNNIEVVAVGIGDDVTTAELDKVEDHNDKSVIVDDTGDLAGLLTNTAGNSHVSGNVLIDPTEEAGISAANDPVGSVDKFGSDGAGDPAIIDLVVDGKHYNENSAVDGSIVLANDGKGTVTFETSLGGILQFNFETGEYTYTAPDKVDHGTSNEVDERFTYTIQDTDGDTDPADLVICIKDNVEPPTVTMGIGVDGQGACIEEDSVVTDPDNQVAVHAAAQNDDTLTQLVITGFNQKPDWVFNFDGMTQTGVTGVVYNAAAGTLTVTFGPGVKTFDGTFGVEPPANTDVDLGTLTATATAAAAGDLTDTLDSSTTLPVTVDANADPVQVTAFAATDSGGNDSFSPQETGTLHIAATFGDSQDGSETHTVVVNVPSVFDITNPAGASVVTNPDGSHTLTFTLDTTGGSDSFSADVGIKATNAITQADYQFTTTVTATETTTGDDECDPSPEDNIATDTSSTTTHGFDDYPTAYDNKQCVNEGGSQNVVIIADVSGSMADDADGKGPGTQSRIDLEKASLTALVDKYAALSGTVTITLIAFASGNNETAGGTDKDGATNLGTFTFSSTSDPGYAAAIAAINSLAIGLGPLNTETEYDDALLLAKDVLNGQLPGQTDGTSNTVYFLSDGNPNPSSNGADAPGIDWKTFVNDNNIEVIAVGIGSGVNAANLDKVEDHTDSSVIVLNPAELAGTLTDAAGNNHVSGNVLTDKTEEAGISPANDPVGSVDTFGNDGPGDPKIVDLLVDGVHYTENSAKGGDVLDNDGAGTLTIKTDLGGILEFNFETGDYTYTAPDDVKQGPSGEVDERFTYTIQDSDGDTDPADLVICIKDNVEPPTVTMGIGVDGKGECVEEDSKVGDADNQVAIHAAAQGDDTLTKLVVTGFDNKPGWAFDVTTVDDGVNAGKVQSFTFDGASLTILFNPGVTSYDGKFGVQPPADSDVDLGKLTATATAAAAGDPTQTLTTSANLDVTVDANADQPHVTVFTVSDTGGNGSFSPNETGTVHVHANFGDFTDGSETHTVTIDVPVGFSVTNAAGGAVTNDGTGTHVTFTVPNGAGGLDTSISVKAGNNISSSDNVQFHATATATETTTGDTECDTTTKDNVATDTTTATTHTFDDHPIANPDSNTTSDIQPQDINLVIVFDRSGSMDDDPNVPGYSSRLELAKAAVAALFEAYQSTADQLHIKIVDFSDTTGHSIWLNSPEEANAYLAKLEADGTTHYDDAIQATMANYNTVGDPVPAADRTEVYFISDGKPNPNSQSLSAQGHVDDWENFLKANHIDQAFAIGVGGGIPANDPDLEDIAYKDADHNGVDDGNSSIVVTNEGQLLATLVGTVAGPPVSGNVLTDPTADVFGADGKGNGGVGLLSIKVGTHTYTYNQATNQIRDETNALIGAGAELIVNPPTLGGTLDFHFDTGAYTFTPINVATDKTESFLYTIVDSDGDTSAANLTLTVTNGGGSVVTPLSHIGTDGNDTINEGGAAADIILSGGDGKDVLTGGAHNDHIQGGNADDKLVGNAGNDILIGGDGNDTLVAGSGVDYLFGGDGDDLLVVQDTANFGHISGGGTSDVDLAGNNTRGDILAFDGTLDLTALANSKIDGIETISMTEAQGGSGDSTDTLTLNASDVIDLGTGHFDPSASGRSDQPAIKVDGDAGDTLNLTGGNWAVQANGNTPAGYTLYVHDTGGSNEDAYVLVQTNVNVVTS